MIHIDFNGLIPLIEILQKHRLYLYGEKMGNEKEDLHSLLPFIEPALSL